MFVLKLSGIQINLFSGMDEESFKAKRDTMWFKTPEAGNIIFCYFIAFILQGPLFLESNSKMKLGDQLINLRTILTIGGL